MIVKCVLLNNYSNGDKYGTEIGKIIWYTTTMYENHVIMIHEEKGS